MRFEASERGPAEWADCCRDASGLAYVVAFAALGLTGSANALVINASYDSSVSSAPTGFKTAFQSAIGFFQSTFADPITINLKVGWGEIDGSTIASGALGQSETYLAGYYSYGQVRNALIADRKSSADTTAIGSLPAADLTGGRRELMATAEAKALGLRGSGSTDGFVGFDATARWAFDPNQRAVSGAFDFIGVAEHEISEVLGRSADLGAISGSLEPLDLFRYSGLNNRALTPGSGQYFSIDSGFTNLASFNGANGGDLGDWAGYTIDAFDAAAYSGVLLPISRADLTALDVIGYDLVAGDGAVVSPSGGATLGSTPNTQLEPVVEPASVALLGAALFVMACLRPSRRHAKAA
jgi:hypothetical protein